MYPRTDLRASRSSHSVQILMGAKNVSGFGRRMRHKNVGLNGKIFMMTMAIIKFEFLI